MVSFLKKKYEVFGKFKEFKSLVENQIDKKIKVLRNDNGGEFYRNEFQQFCTHFSIAQIFFVNNVV